MSKPKKTNLETLMESIRKAQDENLQVILETGVHKDGDVRFIVVNIDKGTAYTVKAKSDIVVSCSCQQAVYRKQLCKHQIKVAGVFGIDLAILDYKYRESLVQKEKEEPSPSPNPSEIENNKKKLGEFANTFLKNSFN